MIPRINTLIHGENSNGVTIRGGASESGAGFFDGGGTGLIWMEDVRITDNAAILQLEDCMVKSTMSGDLTKATCISCGQCSENTFTMPMRCYVEEAKKEKEKQKQG